MFYLAPVATAIVMALLITTLFSVIFRTRHPWGSIIFFLILFLVMWAGGLWIHPFGPAFWGVSWLPLLFLGIFFGFLFLGTGTEMPREKLAKHRDTREQTDTERDVTKVTPENWRDAVIFSSIFWVIIALLIVAIASGYFIH